MGGEPSKKSDGSVCASAGECSSNICAKPCKMTPSAWNRIKDVDNFNRRGFCYYEGKPKTATVCLSSDSYGSKIRLNADGTVTYGSSYSKGSQKTWNKDQCITDVNCGNYEKDSTNVICSGGEWLTGKATSTEKGCELECSGKSSCDTYCWSNKSPHWDCLMYKSCRNKVYKFADGKYTNGYTCYKKQQVASEETMGLTMVDAPGAAPDVNTLAVDAFAIIGLMVVLLMIFRRLTRFVTKPSTTVNKTFTVAPTETTALEISHPEVL